MASTSESRSEFLSRDAPQPLLNAAIVWCKELVDIENAIIAGGFVRAFYAGETPKDMDLYFRSSTDAEDATDILEQAGWEKVFASTTAATYKKDDKLVQVVTYLAGEPEEIIEKFDFTVCAACLTLNFDDQTETTQEIADALTEMRVTGKVLHHKAFFEHLAGRVLVFIGSELPLSSLKRMVKYIKRGYNICDENIIAISQAISHTVDFEDASSLERHTLGMDPDGNRRIRVID
ncbi:MAG: hypothetical protein DRN26_00030 [Thermoplasmata archaeon]|nr:MAG: hypothetical protein DRN26_00030 [Thermoplasmata archaeon]